MWRSAVGVTQLGYLRPSAPIVRIPLGRKTHKPLMSLAFCVPGTITPDKTVDSYRKRQSRRPLIRRTDLALSIGPFEGSRLGCGRWYGVLSPFLRINLCAARMPSIEF